MQTFQKVSFTKMNNLFARLNSLYMYVHLNHFNINFFLVFVSVFMYVSLVTLHAERTILWCVNAHMKKYRIPTCTTTLSDKL